MTDSRSHAPLGSRPSGRPWLVVALALAAAAVLAVLLVVALRGDDDAAPSATQAATAPATDQPAEIVDRAGLEQLAADLDAPLYWAGERQDARYEVTRLADGTVYVRYLPTGTEAGSDRAFLTVATYPRPSAFAEIQRASSEEGAAVFPVGAGGIAVVRPTTPNNVSFALPTVGAQVEVFSPKAGEARRLVRSGAVVPAGGAATPAVAPPFLATAQELRTFAGALEGRAYWAGPRSNKAYEVTRTSDGSVFVRYLPKGATAGAPIDVLTVATYPGRGGIASLKAAAKGDGVETIEIPGGLAVYDPETPTNVHLAFEGGDEQVEVYARSGVDVPALVERGGIVAIAKR